MKKRIFPILMAILMVFAMMPMTAGTVFAEADPDVTEPVIDFDSLIVSISSGAETATVGDTVTFSMNVTDDRYVEGIWMDMLAPISGKVISLQCSVSVGLI